MTSSPSFVEFFEEHSETEMDSCPTLVRADCVYEHLVYSERPTIPPPAHSRVRDLLEGPDQLEAEDDLSAAG
jgi:hypothetical protein